ncbi:MAG TPA: hypothetical protein VKR56_12205 [Candidatus Cybelea sp.]|nr:hypothetical protein [Candidatus Cybelea sp.]
MLDNVEILVIASAIATLLVAILSSIQVSLRSRLIVAAVVGAWIGAVVAVTAAGKLPPLTFLSLFSFPLLGAALLAAFPATRAVLAQIPVPLIIGLNVIRGLGFLFILLALAGRLRGPFPYSAGIGDMLAALFALPVARLAARSGPNDPRVIAWNAFGMLDLVVAVSLGLTSSSGFPLQLIHAGAGSTAITTLPWALVPLVLVPTFLIGHCIVFAHARVQAASRAFGPQRLAGI